jgi:hypothetical protein
VVQRLDNVDTGGRVFGWGKLCSDFTFIYPQGWAEKLWVFENSRREGIGIEVWGSTNGD